MISTGRAVLPLLPALMDRDCTMKMVLGACHLYSWWLGQCKTGFPKRISYWKCGVGGGHALHGFGFNPNHLNEFIGEKIGGYGDQLRKDVRKFYGSVVGNSPEEVNASRGKTQLL
jgi:hypothetical protein